MTAPLLAPRHRRLTPADLDALARRHRAQEAARQRLFDACRTTDTGLLLQRLSRRRLPPEPLPPAQAAAGTAPVAAAIGEAGTRAMPLGLHVARWRDALTARWSAAPRLVRWAAVSAAVKAALVLAVAPAVEFGLARAEDPLVARVERADRCAQSVVVRDGAGRPVWFERPAGASDCDRVLHSGPFGTATAERLAQAIGVLEGRYARRQLTLFGHDLPGLLLGLASTIELKLRGIDRQQLAAEPALRAALWMPHRGSGPILSTFEQLAGAAHPIRDEGRKAAFVQASAIYTARHLRTDAARARFLAERMEAVRVDGAGLGGALAAEALFGRAPETLGELCLFAAASGFALHLVDPGAPAAVREDAERRRARAAHRARPCIERLARDPDERAAALAAVEAFALPAAPFRARLVAETFLPLKDALTLQQHVLPERGGPVALTLDIGRQAAARDAIHAVIDSLPPAGDGAEQSRHWTVAVAEIEGEALPLRIAAASRSFALFGPYRRGADGIERLAPDFGLASQHKAILALVAAAHGETRLCNRSAGTIRNAAGPAPVAACDPARPEGWVGIGPAMGASLNLPWVDLAARHRAEVEALETALGLMGPVASPEAVALGFGRTAPRERFLALFAALAAAQEGREARSEGVSLFAGHPFAAVDLEGLGYGGATARQAARVLAEPLGPDGTLRAVAGELAPLGCRGLLGKSGTGEIGQGTARSRSATVVVTCGARRFVILAEIESARRDLPLGRVTHADLARLIAAALGPLLGKAS